MSSSLKKILANHHSRLASHSTCTHAITHALLLSCFLFLTGCSLLDDFINIKPNDVSTEGNTPGIIKFIALGDAGKGNQTQYQVAEAMQKKCAQDGCDFVLMLGDNIYSSGVEGIDDSQFQTKFEDPYQHLDLPFYLVLGNHDYGSNGMGMEIEKSMHQIKYTKHSQKWNMPRHYYQFKKGNTMFFALDTNAQLYALDADQRKDLTQWIADANTQWKIAFGHHPYLSNGQHGNAGDYDRIAGIPIANGEKVKSFAEDIWCGKVDLYLSGHDHNLQWLNQSCAGTQIIVSGSGASTTPLRGNNPVLFQQSTPGFLYVTIKGNKLSGQFVDSNGEIIFSHDILKPL